MRRSRGTQSLLEEGGAPAATGSPRALGKVALTFPEEGPPDGRSFPARRERGGRGARAGGWGHGVLSRHPAPNPSTMARRAGAGPSAPPYPPEPEGPHLVLCCHSLANTQVPPGPHRPLWQRPDTGLCALGSW